MNKRTDIASRFAAAALSAALAATPATVIAQPAGAQCDSCADSFLIALEDAGCAAFEVTVTDLDTYVNEDGDYVDYVAFNARGTRYVYEIEHFTGVICKSYRYRCSI